MTPKMPRTLRACTGAAFVLLTVSAGYADTYSIDPASPSVGSTRSPADILSLGASQHVAQGLFGLQAGDNLDALSDGTDPAGGVLYFSVDRTSHGLTGLSGLYPYSVDGQAALGHQAADVFVTINAQGITSTPAGYNMLASNQTTFGLAPGKMPWQPYAGAQDNMDALSFNEFDTTPIPGDGVPDRGIFFSLAPGSPTLATLAASPADILLWNPSFGGLTVFVSAASMGLTGQDDLDALTLAAVPQPNGTYLPVNALFSLGRGSPSLSGQSPADIFYSQFDGTHVLRYTAGSLGLGVTDNVDALEISPPAAAPEPGTLALLAVGGVAAVGACRRRGR